jgi:hypothetical protein
LLWSIIFFHSYFIPHWPVHLLVNFVNLTDQSR